MSEEIENAAVSVPRSIVTSIVINGFLGFGILLATLFGLGDINTVLNSPTGFPFMGIFLQATGSIQGTTAMTSIIIALGFSGTIGFVATSSRMIWSFARDRGLPFSSFLSKVENPKPRPRSNLHSGTKTALTRAIRSNPIARPHSPPSR